MTKIELTPDQYDILFNIVSEAYNECKINAGEAPTSAPFQRRLARVESLFDVIIAADPGS